MKKEQLEKILVALVAALIANGYIRVDGLWCKPVGGAEHIIAKAQGGELRNQSNNGWEAFELPDGSVWLRVEDVGTAHAHLSVRAAAGPLGLAGGCHVPLSNGEQVSARDIFRRVVNPSWVPEYLMTEAARAAGF